MSEALRPIAEPLEPRRLLSAGAGSLGSAVGSLDPSFGQAGQVTLSPGEGGSLVGIDSAGRIYLRNANKFTRLTSSGEIDPSYGSGGTMTADVGISGFNIQQAAVQPDGKVIVGGNVQVGTETPLLPVINASVARINPNGMLDPTFGTNGSVSVSISIDNSIDGITVLPGGKVLVVADDYNGFGDPGMVNDRPDLLQFNGDGTPDPTFGSNGKVLYQVPGLWFSTPSSYAVDPDGSILVSGSGTDSDAGGFTPFVMRFAANGTPDPTFGSAGVAHADGLPIVGPSHAILLLGTGPGNWSIQRLNPSGFVDPSFGGGGSASTNIGIPGNPSAPTTNSLYGAVPLLDGSVLAVGFVTQFSQLAIVHYTPDGRVDGSFGKQGRELHPFPQGSPSGSVFRELDGKLLVQSGTELVRIVPPTPTGTAKSPELAAANLQVTGLAPTVSVGQRATVTLTISNGGNARAQGAVQLRIVAATSFNPAGVDLSSAVDLATATRTLRLPPGGSRAFRFHVKLPATLQPGTYEVAGAMMPLGALAEAGSVSETAVGPTVRISPPTADLALTISGRAPVRSRDGRAASILLQLRNLGNAPAAGTVDLSVYASGDQTLDPADTILAAVANLPIQLAPGRSRTFHIAIGIPSGLAMGAYFLIASAAPHIQPPDNNLADDMAISSIRYAL